MKLYLSRNPLKFKQKFCRLTINTLETNYIEVSGELGQLIIDLNRSDQKEIFFTYDSKTTKSIPFNEVVLGNQLLISVENNEINELNNGLNDTLMPTVLELTALSKNLGSDCEESNGLSIIK